MGVSVASAMQAVLVSFAVLVGLSILVFDGRPFLNDASSANAFGYIFALAALLSALFLITRRETFHPTVAPIEFPAAVLRDAPFVSAPPGTATIRVRLPVKGADGAAVYWDDRGVAGVTTRGSMGLLAEVSAKARRIHFRAVRPRSAQLGGLDTVTV